MNIRRLTPRRVARYLLRRVRALPKTASAKLRARDEFIGLRNDIVILNSEHRMFVHRQILNLQESVDELVARIDSLEASNLKVSNAALERFSALEQFPNSEDGCLAQTDSQSNDPGGCEIESNDPSLSSINENRNENLYVIGAITGLPPGSRILHIGSSDSLLPLGLASMGHHVVAVDERPSSFQHSNLEIVHGSILDFEPTSLFDAVVLTSTIEFVGAKGLDTEVDFLVMEKIRLLMKSDGLLVLTAPFGSSGSGERKRTLSENVLWQLLDGYQIKAQPVVQVRSSSSEWALDFDGFVNELDDRQRVVMMVATPIAR